MILLLIVHGFLSSHSSRNQMYKKTLSQNATWATAPILFTPYYIRLISNVFSTVSLQFAAMITMRNAVWSGCRMLWHIDVAPAVSHHACPYVAIASRRATIRTMTSICFYHRRAVLAIVAIHLWWRQRVSAVIMALIIASIVILFQIICWPWRRP